MLCKEECRSMLNAHDVDVAEMRAEQPSANTDMSQMKLMIISRSESDSLRHLLRIPSLEQEVAVMKTRNVVLQDELGAARREVLILQSAPRQEPGANYITVPLIVRR